MRRRPHSYSGCCGHFDDSGELGLHVAAHLVWREESLRHGGAFDELDRMIDHHDDYASRHVDTR